MSELPSPFYLLWPILMFIEDTHPFLGTIFLQADIIFAASYLLFITSAYVILYASAARKQLSLTGVILFIIGMAFLLLSVTGNTQWLGGYPAWWAFTLTGPILLGIWWQFLRRKNVSLEVPVIVVLFGVFLTYVWTLPGILGLFIR